MKIETYTVGVYKVLKISGQQHISDLSELNDLISGYLQRGNNSIAVNFCDASYIYSGAITVLIDCYKKIREKGGTLYILEPHRGLHDILEMLNIDRIIPICASEDNLKKTFIM